MSEAFSITKLAKSPFTGIFWLKCIMFGLGIGCLAFIGWGVYKAYFKTHDPTTTQQAEQINNPAQNMKMSPFSCTNVKVFEYYRKKADQ